MKSKLTQVVLTIMALSVLTHSMGLADNSGEDFTVSEFKKLVWGQETNGVRIGLLPGNPQNNRLAAQKALIIVVLTNNTANQLAFVLPEIPFRFDLAVFDEKGNPVSRTVNGQNIGKLLPEVESPYAFDKSGHQYDKARRREFLSPHSMDFFTSVNLVDYFKIEKPGKYRVEYEQRLQIATLQTNGVSWVGLVCPKVTTTIEVY